MNWLKFILPRYWPRQMSDGSTLQELPPERVDGNYDGWAVKTWSVWREGGASYNTGGDQEEEVCPGCYYAGMTGNAGYMATNHPEAKARRRWSRTAEIDRRRFEALGDCQCGKHLRCIDLDLSYLAQYFPPRAGKQP